MSEILTFDNFLHSLVAVAFTSLSLILLMAGGVPDWFPFMMAALAGIGLYLREAAQVHWRWTLPENISGWPSFHKHMEWVVGTVAAFIAAALIAVLT